MERIGIYGGTFNPPHIGHLRGAAQAIDALGLDKLILIPDRIAPHKQIPSGSPSPEQRLEMTRLWAGEKMEVCDIELVPIGTAWQNARKNTYDIGGEEVKVGDILCNKDPDGTSGGDCDHDGTTGGGQYLNALVWFELFSGKSCVGTTWRPTKYEVREDRALALQKAAHEAIAYYYGADFAK